MDKGRLVAAKPAGLEGDCSAGGGPVCAILGGANTAACEIRWLAYTRTRWMRFIAVGDVRRGTYKGIPTACRRDVTRW